MTKPNNPHFLAYETMDLLDDIIRQATSKVVSDSERLTEASSHARLSHLRGLTEARDAIYNALPKELQNGWDLRRTERSRTTGPPSTGGAGAEGTTRRRQKRSTKTSRKTRDFFSAFNRSRHPRRK